MDDRCFGRQSISRKARFTTSAYSWGTIASRRNVNGLRLRTSQGADVIRGSSLLVENSHTTAAIWENKEPGNPLTAEMLDKFPAAEFVNNLRLPAEVAASSRDCKLLRNRQPTEISYKPISPSQYR